MSSECHGNVERVFRYKHLSFVVASYQGVIAEVDLGKGVGNNG